MKKNKLLTFILCLGTLTVFFPLYMAIIIAFKQPSEMTNSVEGALSLPKTWSFSNFAEAMRVTDFWHSLGNSLFITVGTIVLAILVYSLAGYALGRGMNGRKGFKTIYFYIVSGMFVPFAILMMPLVKEAAQVDGLTTWQTFWKIIFPMMKPMHATVAVMTALGTWNDVMTPLVIMSGTGQNTLPIAQLNFQTQFGTNYNLAFASYVLSLIPILVFYIVCQKQILNGVANGAVKG